MYGNANTRRRLGNPSILLPTALCKNGIFCPILTVLFVHFFDLEDMGLKVDVGGQMCDWVAAQGLAEAEFQTFNAERPLGFWYGVAQRFL
jgi:hypothetical protein